MRAQGTTGHHLVQICFRRFQILWLILFKDCHRIVQREQYKNWYMTLVYDDSESPKVKHHTDRLKRGPKQTVGCRRMLIYQVGARFEAIFRY